MFRCSQANHFLGRILYLCMCFTCFGVPVGNYVGEYGHFDEVASAEHEICCGFQVSAVCLQPQRQSVSDTPIVFDYSNSFLIGEWHFHILRDVRSAQFDLRIMR